MHKLTLLCVASIVISSTLVESNILKDCSEDPSAKLVSVTLAGCDFDSDSVCYLVKNTDAKINVTFKAEEEIEEALVKISGKLGMVTIPFPIYPDQACNNWGLKCPIKPNEQQVFAITMPIKSNYPQVAVTVQLQLIDQDMNQVVCIAFPAQIVDKKP